VKQRQLEDTTRAHNALASQLSDICADLLKQKAYQGVAARKWLTPDVRMWLTIVSSLVADAIRSNEETMQQFSRQLEQETVSHLSTFSRGTQMLMIQLEACGQAESTATELGHSTARRQEILLAKLVSTADKVFEEQKRAADLAERSSKFTTRLDVATAVLSFLNLLCLRECSHKQVKVNELSFSPHNDGQSSENSIRVTLTSPG